MAKLTTAQLKALAEEHGIDISSATTNTQRQELIDAELKRREGEQQQVPPPADEDMDKEVPGPNPEMTEEEAEEERQKVADIMTVKNARVNLDELLQLGEHFLGRNHDLCESIFKAKSWLGKVLGAYGSVNPYITKELIKHASDIPATADVAESGKLLHKFDLMDQIEKVTYLRDRIAEVIKDGEAFRKPESREEAIAVTQFYVHTCEARFELGKILGLIREGKF